MKVLALDLYLLAYLGAIALIAALVPTLTARCVLSQFHQKES